MLCRCDLVEFDGDLVQMNLGRVWDLGPVVVSKDLGSSALSIIGLKETFDKSLITLTEFKRAILKGDQRPFMIKFAVNAEQGAYGYGSIEFDDKAMCTYVETKFDMNKIILNFDLVAKGKELVIFNGISGETKRTGDQKPLFWASVLKRDLYQLNHAKDTNTGLDGRI